MTPGIGEAMRRLVERMLGKALGPSGRNARAPGEAKLVFIGDSITWNWQQLAPGTFRPAWINRGIPAQKSMEIIARFQADVVALRPDAVHIMSGTNDLCQSSEDDALDTAFSCLASMCEIAAYHGMAVVLAGVPPVGIPTRIAELNGQLRAFAAGMDVTYVDYAEVLAGAQGLLDEACALDVIHPNADGYARMTPLADDAIRTALDRRPRARRTGSR